MASLTGNRMGLDSRSGLRSLGDPWILLTTILLIGAGLLAILSVDSVRHLGVFKKQIMFVMVGLVPLAVFWRTPIDVWRKLANVLYGINIAFLLIVFAAPKDAKGAGRWIDIGPMQFQPSEFSKLCVILTLATFYANRRAEVKEFKTFALSFAHVAPLVLLIFKQPHLGASIGVLGIWYMISIVAGVPWKYLVGVLALASVAVGGVLTYNPKLIFKDYMLDRIDKTNDAKGGNYQVEQAKQAVANGGVTGAGYQKGEKTRGQYIPEQHNDFVSTVIAEEGGLVAYALLLLTFGVLFFRIWLIIAATQDPFCKLVATGVLSILSFHTIVNLSMNIEILPVVGLWLPFLSSGGTALWLCVSLVGLALSCSRETDRSTF